ncbi:sensor histidine kinase [Weissella paramesenteroides]|uniref:sensor histidine kinase n=1 Tax=Weissella paramesenteroides TaxID=1249 RepID=UPI003F7441FA
MTTVVTFIAVNYMLIDKKEGYLIVFATLSASLLGVVINLLLLRPIFKSLNSLRNQTKSISNSEFAVISDIHYPLEFKELSDDINHMSLKLKDTFETLHASEYEKNIMIGQLSHDIKTPITSIKSTIEAITDGIIPKEEVGFYLNTMNHQTDRLNSLVEELSYVSNNKEHNGPITNVIEVYVDQLIIELLSEFQFQLENEHRNVEVNIIPENANIYTEKDKLYRILFNLVNNALKYSDKGTKIRIDTILKRNLFTFKITDHGKGIPPKDIDNIFQRLYRVDESRNSQTGGHGLGLYIAKELVEQLGGRISVKSEENKGSTFSVDIPISFPIE